MVILRPGQRVASLVTNLNPQPFPSAALTRWSANYATGGAGTATYETGGINGLPFYRMTWSTASTEINRGAERAGTTGMIVAGRTYTVSGFVRVGRAQSLYISALATGTNGAGIDQFTSTPVVVPAATWAWLSRTFVAPASSVGVSIRVYSGVGGSNWAVGDTLDVTGLMLTEGQPVPYFDGNTPKASWAGTAGDSRSSTLALDGIYPVGRLGELGTCQHSQGPTAGTNYLLPNPIPANAPGTMYAVHLAGPASARANLVTSAGTSIFAVGRNGAGTGWFALAMNSSGGSVVPSVARATGPNVVAGVREELSLLVHSLAGNMVNSTAMPGWPQSTTHIRVNSSSDVRLVELWDRAHPQDIRFARMSQLRTLTGIAA